jgi:O-antigen/teichoic acid export membrane protein
MSHANPKRLLKNTLFLYFRLILTLGVSLYTSREVLAALGVIDYGIYNIVAGAVTMLAFLNGAMASGTQRFLSFEQGKNRNFNQQVTFNTALVIHLLLACIILLLAQTLGLWSVNHLLTIPPERQEAARWILQFSIFGLMAKIIQVPYTAVIIARERMDVYAYMSFVDVASKLAIVYVLGVGGFDNLKLYGALQFATTILVCLIYLIYCRHAFSECRFSRKINWAKAREMTSFVGWNLSAYFASALSNQGTNMLLNVFFGPTVNAARGIAVQASGTIQGFVSNFQVASAPQIVKTYAAGEIEQEKKLISFSCKLTFLLLFLMACPIFLESHIVLGLWLKNPPPETSLYLRIILIDALIGTSFNPMLQAIMATGKIKRYQAICSSAMISGVFCSWFLLRNGSPAYVVFYVTIGVSLLLLWLRLATLSRMIDYNFQDYARVVLAPCLKVVGVSILPPLLVHSYLNETILRFILVTAAAWISIPVAIFYFGLDKKESSFVLKKVISLVGLKNKLP